MRRMMRTLCPLAAATVGLLAACGGADPKDSHVASDAVGAQPAESRQTAAARPERTATQPASPCEWLPAGEVEAVVGALNGPPRMQRGGCFHPLMHWIARGAIAVGVILMGSAMIGCALALTGIALMIDMLILAPVLAVAHGVLRSWLG
jgi:hypothetical protein